MNSKTRQTTSSGQAGAWARFLAPGLLVISALLAGVAAKLPLLVFHLDLGTVPWTPGADGQYGTWALWTASALCLVTALVSLGGKNLTYLPILTAILLALVSTLNLLAGLAQVPMVGSHRLLLTDQPAQWDKLARATKIEAGLGPGLFLIGAALLCMALASWLFHRENHRTTMQQGKTGAGR